MKSKLTAALLALAASGNSSAQGLLPGYNSASFPDVLTAAKGVALPYLLRQGYATLAGVTVADSALVYKGIRYVVHQVYQNGGSDYSVAVAQYAAYGLGAAAKAVWPYSIPNLLYRPDSAAWWGTGDCVSYVVRALAATGDTTGAGNAYLNLIGTVKAAGTTLMASKGYFSTAYQLGAAFPTLGAGDPDGWQYVAGGVVADSIDATNHAVRPGLGTYNGIEKGGFEKARGGDVLAWSYPRSASFNGHLMILERPPVRLGLDSLQAYMPGQTTANVQALLARFRVYAAPLYDCSGRKAHFRDSRLTVSGVGHGTVLVLTRLADDVPQGFLFGAGSVSGAIRPDTLGPSVFAISVGRWKGSATDSGGPSGIGQVLESRWSVYPNPAGDRLYVRVPNPGALRLIDLEGHVRQVVPVAGGETESLSITDLPVGTYFVQYHSAAGVQVQKVLRH